MVLNNYLLNQGLCLPALPVHVTVLQLQVRTFIHLVTFSFLVLILLLLRIRFSCSLQFIITSENFESFLYFQLYVRIHWRRNQPNSKSPVVLRTVIEKIKCITTLKVQIKCFTAYQQELQNLSKCEELTTSLRENSDTVLRSTVSHFLLSSRKQ